MFLVGPRMSVKGGAGKNLAHLLNCASFLRKITNTPLSHRDRSDRQDLAESRLDFGKKLSLRIEKEEKEMRGIHDSVETVNAAAAVFVSAESWVQQVTVPVSRHTPFLCFWFLCSAFPTWLFILFCL
ncbi:hypothetical protein BHM03_00005226 [Ensete ventricosum]|nr:hypothetical protein BHM03_00005226 [Ensete ventricosum]